jgi:hypothetical protein
MDEGHSNFSGFQGQMADLMYWISKVSIKKKALKRCPRKDLRLQAILTMTLVKARTLVRVRR